jgi:hypothetical protein
MNIKSIGFLLLIVIALGCSLTLCAQSRPLAVPKEVQNVTGTYSGSWILYTLDANAQVIKQYAWVDTMKADKPVVEKGRAFVTTSDQMFFEGGKIPPMKVAGKEGYLINTDNSLGDYFIETYGQTYKMQKLAENVFVYSLPVPARELSTLGVHGVISAQHTLIKVVTFEQGIETHNISRLTTVLWKDAAGKEQTTQFISLKGRHQKLHN